MKHLNTYNLFEASKNVDLDLYLFKEIISDNPDENKILSLINKGAEFRHVNTPNDLLTGLHMIAEFKMDVFLKFSDSLLKKYMYVKNSTGETPLHLAAKSGYITFMEYALNHKYNIDPKNNNGNTPLMSAIDKNSDDLNDMIFFLIKYNGADVDTQNNYGSTPLHVAAISDNEYALRTLLEEGLADPTIKNIKGKSFLNYLSMDCKNVLYDEDLQLDFAERYPEIIAELHRMKILKKSVADKYPELVSGSDLNLL